ncbi:MAG: 4Fe-4S binding protein [Candidatus Eisenbacteria bacterium]|nr:4Fe-4S binding protein [Candidatus Latescibacterota bacterium]MBD3301165.1 4Fe-4S binding protein [Candidatus Eisenbacteria bacterium]
MPNHLMPISHPLRRAALPAAVFLLAVLALSVGAPATLAEDAEAPAAGETRYLPDGTPVRVEASEPESAPAQAEPKGPDWLPFLLRAHYLAFLALMLVGIALLLARWVTRWVRIAMLAVAFFLFGIDLVFPLHPSPMCAATKLFTFKVAHGTFFPQFIALFLVMMVPSLIGRKLFCGWVCPLGAFQSLVHKLPFPIRRRRFSFAAFNGVRFALLGLFFVTIFAIRDWIAALAESVGADPSAGVWAAFSAYSIYEPINFFELLHWQLDTVFLVMLVVLIVASLVLYRPFCYAICPIGAFTWILERVAPGRVRVDESRCNGCGVCIKASPCPTIDGLVEGKRIVPDCTSCGACIGSCPTDAIRFGFRGR